MAHLYQIPFTYITTQVLCQHYATKKYKFSSILNVIYLLNYGPCLNLNFHTNVNRSAKPPLIIWNSSNVQNLYYHITCIVFEISITAHATFVYLVFYTLINAECYRFYTLFVWRFPLRVPSRAQTTIKAI